MEGYSIEEIVKEKVKEIKSKDSKEGKDSKEFKDSKEVKKGELIKFNGKKMHAPLYVLSRQVRCYTTSKVNLATSNSGNYGRFFTVSFSINTFHSNNFHEFKQVLSLCSDQGE